MKKKIAAVSALTLILGLAVGTSAQAASPSAKPTIAGAKKAANGKEGTATHEMSEATTGTGEEGSKKVAKATTSVIKKKATAKASPSPKK
jgi:pectate lyase